MFFVHVYTDREYGLFEFRTIEEVENFIEAKVSITDGLFHTDNYTIIEGTKKVLSVSQDINVSIT